MSIDWSSDSSIPADALAELLSHFDDSGVAFENTRVASHELGCDILTDVHWRESDSDGPSHTVHHTVAFLHRPKTTLPEFEIRPRTGLRTRLLGMLVAALGMPSLELEDEPALNERYWIVTANPESVRVLLGREAIDSLLAVDDLVLKFGGRGVLISRHSTSDSSSGGFSSSNNRIRDHRLDAAASVRLLEDAMIAGGPIVDDPAVGRRAAEAVDGSFAEEAVRSLQNRGGFIGRQLARTTITAEMLERIRDARTPRVEIPKPLVRRAWGGTTIPLLFAATFGVTFTGIGLVSAVGGSAEAWVFVAIGLLACVIFGLVLRFRWRRRRLIRHGVVVEGRITTVERTNTSINDDAQHRITVETTDGGDPVVVTMGSVPARQARRLKEAGHTTWILRDPARPTRGLWLEGWCLERALD